MNSDSTLGTTCQLKQRETILPGTENDGYSFTGLDDDIKNSFDRLYFYNANISFIPREAFQEFPNLKFVGFYDVDLRTINYEWLKNFLKFERNLEGLIFYNCHINEIDHRVVEIFGRYKRIILKFNNCYDGNIDDADVKRAEMNSRLQGCFSNFRTTELEKSVRRIEENFSSLQHTIDEINQKLKKLSEKH